MQSKKGLSIVLALTDKHNPLAACMQFVSGMYVVQQDRLIVLSCLQLCTKTQQFRAGRYDDMYRTDEIKSLSFHIMFYRLFRGVAKYIVYGNTFSSFSMSDCDF